MTGSPKELADRLSARAHSKDMCALVDEKVLPMAAHGHREDAKLLREAVAKLVEMEAALKPFAEIAERDIGDDEADHDFYHVMSERNAHAPLPRVGHFRAASRALSQKDEGQ